MLSKHNPAYAGCRFAAAAAGSPAASHLEVRQLLLALGQRALQLLHQHADVFFVAGNRGEHLGHRALH